MKRNILCVIIKKKCVQLEIMYEIYIIVQKKDYIFVSKTLKCYVDE